MINTLTVHRPCVHTCNKSLICSFVGTGKCETTSANISLDFNIKNIVNPRKLSKNENLQILFMSSPYSCYLL